MNNHDLLTPAQAAQAAQVSRPTISRALKAGELLGFRDNGGAWRIKRDDLNAWINARASVHHERRSHSVHEQPSDYHREQLEQARKELAEAREQIARLEGQATAHAERLADALADRDAWRAQAQQVSERPIEKLAGKSSFFTRLLRRR